MTVLVMLMARTIGLTCSRSALLYASLGSVPQRLIICVLGFGPATTIAITFTSFDNHATIRANTSFSDYWLAMPHVIVARSLAGSYCWRDHLFLVD